MLYHPFVFGGTTWCSAISASLLMRSYWLLLYAPIRQSDRQRNGGDGSIAFGITEARALFVLVIFPHLTTTLGHLVGSSAVFAFIRDSSPSAMICA